jgi:hypothetical protein
MHTEFVHWTAANSTGATGTLNGSTVTLEGPMGTAFFLQDDYLGFNTPSHSPQLVATGMVEIVGGTDHHFKLAFDSPMDDVVFQLGSLGSFMTFPVGTTITRVSGDEGFSLRGNEVVGTPAGAGDANGTIRLTGRFDTISFDLRPNFVGGSGTDGVFLQVGGTSEVDAGHVAAPT